MGASLTCFPFVCASLTWFPLVGATWQVRLLMEENDRLAQALPRGGVSAQSRFLHRTNKATKVSRALHMVKRSAPARPTPRFTQSSEPLGGIPSCLLLCCALTRVRVCVCVCVRARLLGFALGEARV